MSLLVELIIRINLVIFSSLINESFLYWDHRYLECIKWNNYDMYTDMRTYIVVILFWASVLNNLENVPEYSPINIRPMNQPHIIFPMRKE